jgi:hypothetical protein
MRAMFLEKRSISTLEAAAAGADSWAPGARVTGWGVGFSSGGWTPGFCNSGLVEGSMAHLALDILPGYVHTSNFNHLTTDFVGHIAGAFTQCSLKVIDGRNRILFLHRQPAVALDHLVGHSDAIGDLLHVCASTFEPHTRPNDQLMRLIRGDEDCS